ncbi:LOW QUALITY PROTEIN: hypothetical protein KIPB_001061 [Kipferlia bialata]|uniref:Calcineurin-like phosphoesterase domain-containing protein n=1 Tax=Kipferlia bialata TaxID=797122 RepID=A0A9K3CQ41_9EUKA|nr:LOW QUALITY PROTEIN: hypothetical protein KIPB_001061 [Kipferlia bialata]
MLFHTSLLLCVCAVCVCVVGASPRLHFQTDRLSSSDATFSVMQITDTHIYTDPESSTVIRTMEQLYYLVQIYRPDMLVLTGDVTSNTVEDTKRIHVEMCQLPYMVTFGNHDSDAMSDYPFEGWREELLSHIETECGGDDSLFLGGVFEDSPTSTEGKGTDYVVPVYADSDSDDVAALVWAFDSHSHYCEGEHTVYGCIEHTQAQWASGIVSSTYTDASGSVPPSLAFFHIPTAQWDIRVDGDTGIATAYPEGDTVTIAGERGEGISWSKKETGILEELLAALGNTYAMSVGHDHFNSYCLETPLAIQPASADRPVALCYGGKMGVSSYWKDQVLSGCRMFELTLSPSSALSIETYLVRESQSLESKWVEEVFRVILEAGQSMVRGIDVPEAHWRVLPDEWMFLWVAVLLVVVLVLYVSMSVVYKCAPAMKKRETHNAWTGSVSTSSVHQTGAAAAVV